MGTLGKHIPAKLDRIPEPPNQFPSKMHLSDDWGDNRLTNRIQPGLYGWCDYRPEWTILEGNMDVVNKHIEWEQAADGKSRLGNPKVLTEGTWVLDYKFDVNGNDTDGFGVLIVHQDADNYILVRAFDSATDEIWLTKWDAGTSTNIITSALASGTSWHTQKVTRTAPDSWELFVDGVSQGTGTDSFWPTENYTGVRGFDSAGGSVCFGDNYKVY